MLYALGQVGNKVYEKESPVPVADIVRLFPDMPFPAPGAPVYLEYTKQLLGKDADGIPVNAPSVAVQTKMQIATEDGSMFSLRMDTGKAGREKNRIILNSLRTKLEYNDLERAVFLILSPQCMQSPKRSPRPSYQVVDPGAEKRAQYDLQLKINSMTTLILRDLPELALNLKASSIVINGESARDEIKNGEFATRGRLVTLLNKYPKAFIKEWDDNNSGVEGMLWYALTSGLIVRGEDTEGRKTLRFSNELGGTRITNLGAGSEFNQLKTAVQVNPDLVGVIRKYFDEAESKPAPKRAIPVAMPQTKAVEPDPADEDSDLTEDAKLIAECKALGILSYDAEHMSVDMLNSKNMKSTLTSLTLETVTRHNGSWEEALETIFTNNKSLRKQLQLTMRHRIGRINL